MHYVRDDIKRLGGHCIIFSVKGQTGRLKQQGQITLGKNPLDTQSLRILAFY